MAEHDDVALLVPWYANGTLEESERGRVEGHLESCASCGELLRQARLHRRSPRPRELLAHVHPVLLTMYDEDPERLEPETREWVEGRLADCPACREARDLLRDVSRSLAAGEEETESSPRRSGSRSVLRGWFGTLLRPSFALAYLLLLAVLVPLLWRSSREPAALSPRLLAVGGDQLTRAPGEPAATPLRIDGAGGPVLLQLRTELIEDDLRDPRLTFSLEILRTGVVRWSEVASASAFEMRDGHAVASLLLTPARWPRGEVHEVVLRAHKPGDPLDGQILFRRSFVVFE